MFQEKVKIWIEGDARNSVKKISMSQFSVLNKFAAWLDRDAQQRNEAVAVGQTCPLCEKQGYRHIVGTDWREKIANDGQV